MTAKLVIRGRYIGGTFVADQPLPSINGAAELVITVATPPPRHSIATVFGNATVPRSGEEILAEARADRDQWDTE